MDSDTFKATLSLSLFSPSFSYPPLSPVNSQFMVEACRQASMNVGVVSKVYIRPLKNSAPVFDSIHGGRKTSV